MIIQFNKKAERRLRKLPKHIIRKMQKQCGFLQSDINHPSLHTKRMKGVDRWEARIDYQYRFTFCIEKETIMILSVGPHDEGLGAK